MPWRSRRSSTSVEPGVAAINALDRDLLAEAELEHQVAAWPQPGRRLLDDGVATTSSPVGAAEERDRRLVSRAPRAEAPGRPSRRT